MLARVHRLFCSLQLLIVLSDLIPPPARTPGASFQRFIGRLYCFVLIALCSLSLFSHRYHHV